jgi:Domain of Unknown Function (DUF1080)
MNRGSAVALSLAIGIVVSGIGVIVPSRADDEDDFKPLFNGKDLQGWEATQPELWSVKDGMIIGKQGKSQLQKNTFLAA